MPAAKKKQQTPEETLAAIAAIVRHPECAENGGRNRYKRGALVQICELTEPYAPAVEPGIEEAPAAEETAEPESAPEDTTTEG
jgi:hypothetical protein